MSFQDKIVYQIFPKTFFDANNDGFGDIQGIIKKIRYLAWLGINEIWITPIFLSPFRDSGYDVQNYYEINPKMGTMNDFECLIQEAKKQKIGIILDMVFNHTSDKNIWFAKALKGDKGYQDYYYFLENTNKNVPTNWKSKVGGSCWQYLPNLDKYYLHIFDKAQPDLNWRNKKVRDELKKILDFWIKKGVKGFRFDVCNLYSKPDKFVDDLTGDGRKYYTDGKKMKYYLKDICSVFNQKKNFLTVGELSSTSILNAVEYSKPSNKLLQMVFVFHHLKVDYLDNKKWTYMLPDIDNFGFTIKTWQEAFCRKKSWLGLFLNNHDQPRSVSRFGDDKNFHYESATALATFIFMLRGTPFIYQGEEIGMTNYPFKSINDFFDNETIGNARQLLEQNLDPNLVFDILLQKARDHSRTVMQWDDSVNAGFSEKDKIDIPVNPNYQSLNVFDQSRDKNSILSFYRKLIKLRKTNEILKKGKIKFLNDKVPFVYERSLNNKTIYVIVNISNKIQENPIYQKKFKILTKNILLKNYKNKKFDKLLSPYECLVVQK